MCSKRNKFVFCVTLSANSSGLINLEFVTLLPLLKNSEGFNVS